MKVKDGISIALHFTPDKMDYAKAIGEMIDKLLLEASLYGDSGYIDY
ncbi:MULTISPECIES: hypothetical protein [Flavobacterium]|nr:MULTISPECIES: hypothetical protein [Flavobacterium]